MRGLALTLPGQFTTPTVIRALRMACLASRAWLELVWMVCVTGPVKPPCSPRLRMLAVCLGCSFLSWGASFRRAIPQLLSFACCKAHWLPLLGWSGARPGSQMTITRVTKTRKSEISSRRITRARLVARGTTRLSRIPASRFRFELIRTVTQSCLPWSTLLLLPALAPQQR